MALNIQTSAVSEFPELTSPSQLNADDLFYVSTKVGYPPSTVGYASRKISLENLSSAIDPGKIACMDFMTEMFYDVSTTPKTAKTEYTIERNGSEYGKISLTSVAATTIEQVYDPNGEN